MKKRKTRLEYEHFCLQCNKKFKTHKKNIVVCSPKCALARKREKDKLYWKNYYEKNKDKILSKNRQWWQDNKGPKKEKQPKEVVKKKIYEKECPICHTKFLTKNCNTKYCLLHRYRRRPTNVYPCECKYCGTQFWSKHKTDDVCLNPKCIRKSLKESK
jgi:hypothetical protein